MDKKIYIVDDNEAVCDALQFLFDSFFSTEVFVFQDPLKFLEILSSKLEGCLIVDVLMQNMNGLELIKKVKMVNTKLKIILVSGHATSSTQKQAIDIGADAFIAKPFQTDILLNKVKSLIEEYEASLAS